MNLYDEDPESGGQELSDSPAVIYMLDALLLHILGLLGKIHELLLQFFFLLRREFLAGGAEAQYFLHVVRGR